MLFWPPTHGISTTHGILTPYPWYIDPPTHGILTPLSMVYRPLTHGISTPLSMVFWPPYPWNIDPPTHGISNPYTWVFDLSAYLLIRNGGKKKHGGSIYHTGGSVFNKGVQYTMNKNWPRSQFTMGFKIPYDTGP